MTCQMKKEIGSKCAHCTMGRGRTHHHIAKQKSEDESRRPIIAMDYFFMKMEATPVLQ